MAIAEYQESGLTRKEGGGERALTNPTAIRARQNKVVQMQNSTTDQQLVPTSEVTRPMQSLSNALRLRRGSHDGHDQAAGEPRNAGNPIGREALNEANPLSSLPSQNYDEAVMLQQKRERNITELQFDTRTDRINLLNNAVSNDQKLPRTRSISKEGMTHMLRQAWSHVCLPIAANVTASISVLVAHAFGTKNIRDIATKRSLENRIPALN